MPPSQQSNDRYERTLAIPATHAGFRVDKALAELCNDVSRSQLGRWLDAGEVELDGEQVDRDYKVRGGEHVVIVGSFTNLLHWDKPEHVEFKVIYEDDALLVIDKPAGLAMHPGTGNPSKTLVNGLLKHRPQLQQLPRAGLIHRLDKDTTGLLVVAATRAARIALHEAMSERRIEREYLAVLEGRLELPKTVNLPIGRHPTDRLRQAVRSDGRPAVTSLIPKDIFRSHTLVSAKLETGRTHQIRVHMAALGQPLVGDIRYGARGRLPQNSSRQLRDVVKGFSRQALHAIRLAFSHPQSGQEIAFESPIPDDIGELITVLRADAAA